MVAWTELYLLATGDVYELRTPRPPWDVEVFEHDHCGEDPSYRQHPRMQQERVQIPRMA